MPKLNSCSLPLAHGHFLYTFKQYVLFILFIKRPLIISHVMVRYSFLVVEFLQWIPRQKLSNMLFFNVKKKMQSRFPSVWELHHLDCSLWLLAHDSGLANVRREFADVMEMFRLICFSMLQTRWRYTLSSSIFLDFMNVLITALMSQGLSSFHCLPLGIAVTFKFGNNSGTEGIQE